MIKIKFIALLSCFIIKQDCIAYMHSLKLINSTNYEIPVGSKTSDSTGSVSISKSSIQQSIITAIPLLASATVTNTAPAIIIVGPTGYLTFEIMTDSGNLLNVAIPLITSSSNLSYQPDGNNYILLKGFSGCTDCGFTKNKIKILRGPQY